MEFQYAVSAVKQHGSTVKYSSTIGNRYVQYWPGGALHDGGLLWVTTNRDGHKWSTVLRERGCV